MTYSEAISLASEQAVKWRVKMMVWTRDGDYRVLPDCSSLPDGRVIYTAEPTYDSFILGQK